MDGFLDVVRGKRVERVEAAEVVGWLRAFDRSVLDLGTGDGRWVYRQARARAGAGFVGIDANARLMRETSFRAGRKPARGGVSNLLFVRASWQALPQALAGVADELYVLYPWGSLLEMVWRPQPEGLRAIARLVKPAGRFEIQINVSAVGAEDHPRHDLLAMSYAAAGIHLERMGVQGGHAPTSWAGRIAHGREPRVIMLTGTVHGDPDRHPQG